MAEQVVMSATVEEVEAEGREVGPIGGAEERIVSDAGALVSISEGALLAPPRVSPSPLRPAAAGATRADLAPVTAAGRLTVPAIVAEAGPQATKRFFEFFTVPIRNRHTRQAYFHAATTFLTWCEERGLTLEQIEPIHVAAYIEHHPGAPTTKKQHMAAIRMLCSWLVEKGVLSYNPAREVKTEKFSRTVGKTPAFTTDQMQTLFASFDTSHIIVLRDRALIGVMAYTFARIEAVVTLKVKDYLLSGRRGLIRLHEKGGKEKDIPCHHLLENYLDAYIAAAGIAEEKDGPLFRSALGKKKQLSDKQISRTDAMRCCSVG